ncbi:MAG: hypothetical protein O7J95_08480, partial [Planctomycetota bacterium]|nr:hypothetical protein [Planctomycetota bacterium]
MRELPMREEVTRLRFVPLAFTCSLVVLLAAQPLAATDFIRGDTNGDGEVTLADSLYLFGHLFWGTPLACEATGDFENDEAISLIDGIRILQFVAADGSPPAAPFPVAGPDTTNDPDGFQTPCDAYGGGTSFEDPAARLEVLPAVALGGEDVHAVITVAVSNSLRLGSIGGVLRADADIFQDVLYDNRDPVGIQELTTFRTAFRMGRVEDNRIHFGMIASIFDPVWIEPGEDVPMMAFTVCLKPGTPAGEYPLTLESAEFGRGLEPVVDERGNVEMNDDAGFGIEPERLNGTLTVLVDV